MGNASAAGMWMKTSQDQSGRPASSTRTRLEPSADSRFASALPAEPPPTMMKSKRPSVMGLPLRSAVLLRCVGQPRRDVRGERAGDQQLVRGTVVDLTQDDVRACEVRLRAAAGAERAW